ncbi:MAG: hypothetical protein COU47_02080 [Candidatus Niyogibacteria bacterium CG10_big_fil_rev_8_21_14_0_10_46_36]|uniref:Uncharacterized protein n=1 Tax=Candidatus Niyogibacteria bacterium CG10_big_fil_rev_8_21_14_0_10_46_36 TaxID=1974726 RepID=A0A2H0TDP6_9BACT|nr:MAG: hypothetical protein COU47_02080 [Candidatus Niyogibacteria bacterium CG10_big_fil_rev_8_21_14_0_10_46_36]
MNKNPQTINEDFVTSEIFLANYNKTIPKSFPRATTKALEQFRNIYPNLFKNSDEWSIRKHRKRFMDWISSH